MAGVDVQSYIGRVVSLVSKSDIRYEGTLHSIDVDQGTIALKYVKALGTEGRRPGENIPASADTYDHIIFKGSDIKELNVLPALQDLQFNQAQIGSQPGVASQGQLGYDYNNYNNYPQQPYQQQQQQQQQYSGGYEQQGESNVDQWLNNNQIQGDPAAAAVAQLDPSIAAATTNLNPLQNIQQSSQVLGTNSAAAVQKAPVNYSTLVKRGGGRLAPTMDVQRPIQGQQRGGPGLSRGGRGRDSMAGRLNLQNGTQAPGRMGTRALAQNLGGRRPAGPTQGVVGRGRTWGAPPQQTYGRGYQGGRGPPQGYGQPGGRVARGAPNGGRGRETVQPINVPDEDFDFQEQLAKFDKEKLLEELKEKATISDNSEKKQQYTPDNFFDEISCEALERQQQAQNGYQNENRQKFQEQRKIDLQTFGQSALRSQNFGRGGGRGYRGGPPRGQSARGGRFSGYQSSNYKGEQFQGRSYAGRQGRALNQPYQRNGRGGRTSN